MSQTTVDIDQAGAKAGLVEGLNPATKRSWNNSVELFPFGQFGSKVSGDDDGIKLPASSGDDIRGVSIQDLAQPDGEFALNSAVPILSRGEIWVTAEETVAVGDTPYIVYAGKKQVQTITLDADLITANVITTTVDGTSVASTFATDHDTTMTAHSALIAAINGVSGASSAARIITVTSDFDTELTITSVVTLGASQAGIVVAETVAKLPTANRGMLRNDADTSRALDGSSYTRILDYVAVSGLTSGVGYALVSVDING